MQENVKLGLRHTVTMFLDGVHGDPDILVGIKWQLGEVYVRISNLCGCELVGNMTCAGVCMYVLWPVCARASAAYAVCASMYV